ncbi:Hpt domain-containing protein [Chromobacterium phragmitis]|uniref:Hpt domain-containing protein n=1 Tax=Chromobacterium phragmitis TaxID=2202141 RepID=UPI001F1E290C|nr:Hpt domain-containing protein [Chromobacterium phragmitis]
MSEFGGMEELLQDFLMESTDLLSDVDNKLVELEKRPEDKALLNDIFRGFHTIKGGAGFLNVIPMVNLCHRTENLFDKLRNGEMHITPEVMDVILDATGIVRDMFGTLGQGLMPGDADARVLSALDAALAGEPVAAESPPTQNRLPPSRPRQQRSPLPRRPRAMARTGTSYIRPSRPTLRLPRRLQRPPLQLRRPLRPSRRHPSPPPSPPRPNRRRPNRPAAAAPWPAARRKTPFASIPCVWTWC